MAEAKRRRATSGAAPTNGPKKPVAPPTKHPAAVALGRLGGLKGGPARAEALTPERRSEIARMAAQKRWGKG